MPAIHMLKSSKLGTPKVNAAGKLIVSWAEGLYSIFYLGMLYRRRSVPVFLMTTLTLTLTLTTPNLTLTDTHDDGKLTHYVLQPPIL